MVLTVNAISGAAWCCWWLCRKITEKVSSVTIVLRKYQASQMPSSKEPHLACESWVPVPWYMSKQSPDEPLISITANNIDIVHVLTI